MSCGSMPLHTLRQQEVDQRMPPKVGLCTTNLAPWIGNWIDFPLDDILKQFTTLILRGVFRQKAAAAWFGCRAEKAQITVLLPGGSDASSWLDQVDCMSHSWPKSCNIGKMQADRVHAKTFHLHRKFTRARHMWLSLRPDWYLLRYHIYTEWPGIYSYDELNDRLFVNPGRNDNIHDTPSKARYYSAEHREWQSQQMFMAYYIGAQLSQVSLTMKKTLANFEEGLAEEQQEVDEQKGSSGHQIKRWKTKQGVYQLKAPVAMDQAESNSEDPTYAEVLRDV